MPVPPSVRDLIASSGNNFHAKVAKWFTDNGWEISVSPYYLDQTLGKARELDLIAEKFWPVKNAINELKAFLVLRLFIECKFIPGETVFWFSPRVQSNTMRCLGSISKLFVDETNAYTRKHHYFSQENQRVAKLFVSAKGAQPENDPVFKALNQVLSGAVAMKNRPYSTPELQEAGRHVPTLAVDLPVVVCSSFSQCYAVDFLASDTEPTPIADNFLLEVSYAYSEPMDGPRSKFFAIDFVSFDLLDRYATALREDSNAAMALARAKTRRPTAE